MLIIRIFCNIATTMLCFFLQEKNDPAHVSYTKVSIFVHVVFNITMLKVSKFVPQMAHLLDALFWELSRNCTLRDKIII